MRFAPVGLGVVAAIQVIAAATLYPAVTLAVIGTADLVHAIVRSEGGVWQALALGGPLLVAAILLLAGTFLVGPLALCVVGTLIVSRLARRRFPEITGPQLLTFGVTLVAVNVAPALDGAWLWPWWWYTEKMGERAPLWLLVVLVAANAVIDAGAAAALVRSRLRRR